MRWVVGDVHGMLGPLTALLEAVRGEDAWPRFLFVGDYVDRGPDSRGVIDLLLTLKDAKFVRGNHDDMFDYALHGRCLADPAKLGDPAADFSTYVRNGMADTLDSYGVPRAEVAALLESGGEDRLREVMRAVPDAHRAFVRDLPMVIEESDVFVGHALWEARERDVPEGGQPLTLPQQLDVSPSRRHAMLWGRFTDRQIRDFKWWRRRGFFGHTPVETFPDELTGGKNLPIRGPKITLLDTGIAYSDAGRLSAVCVETGKVIQVDRAGMIVDGA